SVLDTVPDQRETNALRTPLRRNLIELLVIRRQQDPVEGRGDELVAEDEQVDEQPLEIRRGGPVAVSDELHHLQQVEGDAKPSWAVHGDEFNGVRRELEELLVL